MQEIIIFGYDEYAKEIAFNFKKVHHSLHLFLTDENSYKAAIDDGYTADLVELDDDWKNIGEMFDINKLLCFCSLDDDAQNVFLTISLRAAYDNLNIISLATSSDSAEKLRLAGANKAIAKLDATAQVIVESLEKPIVARVMNDIFYHKKDVRLSEIALTKNSLLIGNQLEDIKLHNDYNLLLLALSHNGEDTEFSFSKEASKHVLCENDILVIMGKEEDINAFKKVIQE